MQQYPTVLQERDQTKLAQKDGMAKKSATEFTYRIPLFMEFLKECGLETKLNSNPHTP